MSHTDIPQNDWIARYVPAQAQPYARLMRLDRPVGVWLLLLPCLWGLALAGNPFPPLHLILLFAFGALVMRAAGCVVNDLWDRDLDRRVERTKTRPLASGAITPRQAIILLIFLLCLGLGVLLSLNAFTIKLGLASLVLVFTYPLAKRVTWWPQLVLGFAFNWGAFMGWSAMKGELAPAVLLLYGAGVFWTLGYDTIYAYQDMRDDAKIGVKSLALFLGEFSRLGVAAFYGVMLFLLILMAVLMGFGAAFYMGLCAATLYAAWMIAAWNPKDPADCLRRFKDNRDFGFLVLIAILLGKTL